MSTVYSPKVVIIIVTAKQCMEAYITGCWERYVYGPVIEVMDEAISFMEGKDFPVSRERLGETIANLYHEADFLEQSGKLEERGPFGLIAKAMRQTAAFMQKKG